MARCCRQIRSLKDADGALLRTCAFVQGDASMAVGCHGGSMQILNISNGEVLSASESSHSSPINQIRVRLPPLSGPLHMLCAQHCLLVNGT